MNRFFSINALRLTLREADLRPLRQQALRGIKIAIIGDSNTGRHALAEQMRRDPNTGSHSEAPIHILEWDSADKTVSADLIILIVRGSKPDISLERRLADEWQHAQKSVLVLILPDLAPDSMATSPWPIKVRRRVLVGMPDDERFLLEKLVPAVIALVPNLTLTLGRYFPLFRLAIARALIKQTCLSNAAYSMSTGLAEIVAVLDIPITIADTVVLTKAQALMVYKMGLALGFSTRWQDYLGEFGSVLGSGFIFRQTARSLIGIIPVWGIIPKTAIAYAGTYVVGTAILQWYLTGRHLTKEQIRQVYSQALNLGRTQTRRLLKKLPHPQIRRKTPRLGKGRSKPALYAPSHRKIKK